MSNEGITHAAYGKYRLTILLPDRHSIGMQYFDADATNYMQRLHQRTSIPDGLRALIAQLFQRQIIRKCRITYGTRVDLLLSNTGTLPNGRTRQLLSGDALTQFQTAFTEITGQQINVTRLPSGDTPTAARSHGDARIDPSALSGLGRVIDAICDGIVLSAAWDQLFGDK